MRRELSGQYFAEKNVKKITVRTRHFIGLQENNTQITNQSIIKSKGLDMNQSFEFTRLRGLAYIT